MATRPKRTSKRGQLGDRAQTPAKGTALGDRVQMPKKVASRPKRGPTTGAKAFKGATAKKVAKRVGAGGKKRPRSKAWPTKAY